VRLQHRADGVAGLERGADPAEGGGVEHNRGRGGRTGACLESGGVAVDGAERDPATALVVPAGGGRGGLGRRGGVDEAGHELPGVDDLRLGLGFGFRWWGCLLSCWRRQRRRRGRRRRATSGRRRSERLWAKGNGLGGKRRRRGGGGVGSRTGEDAVGGGGEGDDVVVGDDAAAVVLGAVPLEQGGGDAAHHATAGGGAVPNPNPNPNLAKGKGWLLWNGRILFGQGR